MSESKLQRSPNAIAGLKADHQNVKTLFDDFENTDDRAMKTTIVNEALEELSLHATLEGNSSIPRSASPSRTSMA